VLVFFDESFHDSLEEPNVSLGALCGVGIPEDQMSQVEADVLALKRRYFDEAFARDRETKRRAALRPAVGTRKPNNPALGANDDRVGNGSQLK